MSCAALRSTTSRCALVMVPGPLVALTGRPFVKAPIAKTMKVSTTPRRNLSSIMIIAPVPKFGIQMPLVVSPNDYGELYRTRISLRREHPGKAFSRQEMKHNFAIQALERPGFFARQPYIYSCVRCRQIFLVNERRGSIVAIDRNRNSLPEPKNSRPVETFAEGPCPSFKLASNFRGPQPPRTTIKLSKLKLGLLRIVASLCPEFRGSRKIENASKQAQAMLAITPQEFLF
jgi:hypothetical protein